MKVYNMKSPNGNKVANQFVITDADFDRITFQSYDSEIVTIDYANGIIFVGENWEYSRTTGKYRNIFMSNAVGMMENAKDFRSALKSGICVDPTGRAWTIEKKFM